MAGLAWPYDTPKTVRKGPGFDRPNKGHKHEREKEERCVPIGGGWRALPGLWGSPEPRGTNDHSLHALSPNLCVSATLTHDCFPPALLRQKMIAKALEEMPAKVAAHKATMREARQARAEKKK
jgi:hypothetical protein